MTEAELLAVAASQAKQTTRSWDAWLNDIRTNKDYDYRQARWYKAGAALEQVKHLPSPPQPTYGTKATAGPFAGRGIMLGGNPDVWEQALGLVVGGFVEVVACTPPTPLSAIYAFRNVGAGVVIWCPPEIDSAADITQAENQGQWDEADRLAPGVVVNYWAYGRFDGRVALVETYYNEGWGVDFGIFKNYMNQGASAVIPVCGGYAASGRPNAVAAALYENLGKLPFPGFWMYAGESLLTDESVAVLTSRVRPTG